MGSDRFVRISSKGQIVIPKWLRDKIGISPGDYVRVKETDQGLAVEKFSSEMLDEFLEPLRRAAEEQGFTREELMDMIKAMRRERRADAA